MLPAIAKFFDANFDLVAFLKVKDPSRDGAYRVDACDMRKKLEGS